GGTERLWQRVLQTSLGVSVLVGIHGLLQLAGKAAIHQGGVRLDANLGNATYLAVYMLFHVFLSFMFILREDTSKAMRWVYGAILLLDLFVLYHTATRGAILGLLGGAFIASIYLMIMHRDNARVRKLALGGLIAVLLAVGGVFMLRHTAFVAQSPVLSRFASISLEETTTKSRFLIWHMSFEGWKEHPLLGWGQENYILVFNKYYDPGMYAQEPWFDRSHNVFFDWLISGGLLALIAYLSLFGLAFWYLLRKGSSFTVVEKGVLLGLLVGYFFQNIFVFDNLFSYILFYSVLAYIVFRGAPAPVAPPARKHPRPFFPLVASGTGIALVLALYFVNVKPILASMSLIEALKPHQTLDENLSYFEKALGYGTFGSGEAREQLVQAATKVRGLNASDATKQKFAEVANRELSRQMAENPKDARYELFYASFLKEFGDLDAALAHLARARELSPKKQAILFEQGSAYLSKKDYPKALAVLKEAYELEPSYAQARLIYAAAAIYAGEDKLAETLLVPVYGTALVADDRILGAYLARGQNNKVLAIVQQQLAADPTNAQLRLALAELYLRTGDRTKAVAEIRKVIATNPDFKDQGEYFIKEIEAGRNP
ncbi:tetratricopeptide repeat protein, partial [Candidatus Parcubacteria bacterium]|nr:tetratricopeptide repeat protein [Candidatus Parcubacteria bacterium]